MTQHRVTSILAALLTLCWLCPALAAPPRWKKASAKTYFRQGNVYYRQGKYQKALDRFRRAARLFPSYKIDLNICGTLEALTQEPAAATCYGAFLADHPSAPAGARTRAAVQLKLLTGQLARLQVRSPVPGARVWVQGKEVGRTPLGRLFVRPGQVELRVTRAGKPAQTRQLNLKAGGEHKLLISFNKPGSLSASAAQGRSREPAQGTGAQARARALFQQGNLSYQRGDYPAALASFRRARQLFGSYKIDLNICTTLESMGRPVEAVACYRRLLGGGSGAPPALLARVRRTLRTLLGRLASLRVMGPAGATVGVDGGAAGTLPLAAPLALVPGRRRIRVEQAGYRAFEVELPLRAGQRRDLRVALVPADTPAEPAEPGAGGRTIGGYAALGAGLGLAVSAALLYGLGGAMGGKAHDEYMQANDPLQASDRYQRVEDARDLLHAGHGLAGAAAVALGVSIYLLLTRPAAAPPARAALRVGVEPGRGGGLLQIQGGF